MADPDPANVFMVANFIGSDGDTSYTPEKGAGFAFNGAADLSNTVTVFGNTTAYSDGAGGYLTQGDAGDYDFLHDGTVDYTIEGWANRPSIDDDGYLLATRGSNGIGIYLEITIDWGIRFEIYNATGTILSITTDPVVIDAGISIYYKVVFRSSGLTEVWAGGNLWISGTPSGTPGVAGNAPLTFGRDGSTSTNECEVYYGPWRIIRGEALSGSDVPTDIFPSPPGYDVILSVPHPLQNERFTAFNDFTAIVDGYTAQYVMEIAGSPPITIPISSWQATNQTTRSQYLQAVIPACDDYVAELTARQGSENFSVYRMEETIGGTKVRVPISTAPLETLAFSQGAVNYTCVISGYAEPASSPDVPDTIELTGIRSISINESAKTRVRCNIDWQLVPGDAVTALGSTFTADYINYYVNDTQAYMDLGSR